MHPTLHNYKKLIDAYLLRFLSEKTPALSEINPFGPDLIDKLKPIVVAGKTIRGSLALLAYCFTHEKPTEEVIQLAAALELMQTALVVHDDIMDHDDVRRGIPALHAQYDSEALAMCAGDVLFFMAFELIGSIKTDAATLGRIVRLVGREYQSVGVAQMTDVSKTAKTRLEILNLYTYKTARYTFAVPLMAGATLAGTTKETLKYLESYGTATGILFQIQDDRLDREINPFTQKDIDAHRTAAEESLARIPISPQHKKILQNLLHFVLTRNT